MELVLENKETVNDRELTFQFVLLEKSVKMLVSTLEHERTSRVALQEQNNELKVQLKAQSELLKTQKQQVKDWEAKVKKSVQTEQSLNEKIENLKKYSIIAKNPKNAEAVEGLKKEIDSYIRYIDEAIALLKTI